MPYSSSIQIVNDANGTAYAFLVNDGLLWQCQWNPEAQRWDKGQVVPGAYGGEKLQVLVVDNLWPTSSTGATVGNTPGIVLAYRVGEGDNATVQATLGGWGSDGQLSWSEPLQLVGSGSAIEQIHLAQTQAGGFELVYQGREPLGAGSTSTALSASTLLNDSDLLSCSFELSASQPFTGTSYNLVNTTAGGTSNAINFAEDLGPTAPAPQVPGGSTSFSRSDLQLLPAAATTASGLLSAQSSATAPVGSSWSGNKSNVNLSYQKQNGNITAGFNWSSQQVRWKFEPYQNSKAQNELSDDDINQSKTNGIEDFMNVLQSFSGKNQRILELSGSFGASTFGSQAASSSASLVLTKLLVKQDKVETGQAIVRFFDKLKSGEISPTSTHKLSGSVSGSVETKYSFNQLVAPWSDTNYLTKIAQKASVSLGLTYKYNKVIYTTEIPTTFQAQASLEAGFVFINTISPLPKDDTSAFPVWITKVGDAYAYAGGALGLAEGVYGGFKVYKQKKAKKEDWAKYDILNRDGSHSGHLVVDGLLGSIGLAGIVLPDFLYIKADANNNSKLESKQQYGFSLSGALSATFTFLGLVGVKLEIKDSFQYFPFLKDDDDSDNPYLTDSLTVAASTVSPLGPKVNIFSIAHNWQKPAKPPAPSQVASQNSLLGNASSSSTYASSDSDYPFYYEPSQGSVLLASSDVKSVKPLVGGSTQLQLLTLTGYSAGVAGVAGVTKGTTPAPLVMINPGKGLVDGVYSNVAVMGISLPGSAPATMNFTVADGAIVASTIIINSPGDGAGLYLQLPETYLSSGVYALIPNVFSPGPNGVAILQNPISSSSVSLVDLLHALPVITVDSTRVGNPLQIQPIFAIQPVIPLAANPSASYPNQSPSDNSLISYSDVAIQITSTSTNSVTLLNKSTATVGLSNGSIVKVVLSQPQFLKNTDSDSKIPPASLNLTLDLQAVLGSAVTNPTYSVTPQNVGLNNVVEDHSFSANSANSGPTFSALSPAQAVWLTNGINDQLQAIPSQAAWPVFNRVVVQASDGSITYLNSSIVATNGVVTQSTSRPSEVSIKVLYSDIDKGEIPTFSAASTPTAITISGPSGATFTGDTAVFWVEASQPVIPQTTTDGSQNYQAFMTALYSGQRINYRIYNTNTGDWFSPNTLDLYAPTNAVIRNLKSFQVDVGGSLQTLLVWDETSIDTIKGNPPKAISINGWIDDNKLSLIGLTTGLRIGDLITGDGVEKGTLITGIVTPFNAVSGTAVYGISRSQVVGRSSQPVALNAYPLLPPTVLKAGFINPDAENLERAGLFSDSNGNSTITTIPWDQSNDIGLGIESLSVASQQTVDANGNFQDSALLTWSEDVRTPYMQAVLNDEPLIYLQFGDLQPGFNSINFGSMGTSNTGTVASSTGLNFTVPSALPKAAASAVQNIDGTGVLSTGTGSQNSLYNSVLNDTPADQLPSSPFAQLTASITGTTLTVTALSGNRGLDQGDLLTGSGLQPDTQITAVISAFDPTTGTGIYSINQSQNLSSVSFEALPNPAPLSNKELGLPYSSFIGSINGATLNVSQLSGSLAVQDRIYGEGVSEGTTITEVISFDSSTGTGSYTLSQSQQQLSAYALIATPPFSSAPYTIEFWTQLPAGSNGDQGAGLVAFGQPSPQAVGGYEAPSGWLLSASFSVAQITYQQAAAQGSQSAYDQLNDKTATASQLFAWGWSLDATGANTTALGGNGGSNLYSNSLTINNLANGQTMAGVNAFLENYGLTASDLVGGDDLPANSIDLVPGISLDFNNSLDPNGLPVSNLNAVNIDTTSAPLNSGLVEAINANGDLSTNTATNQNLQNMFQSLWNYQVQYGEAKVGFTLNPEAAPQTGSGFEQYGGYTLDFTVAPGPAISVNQQGQLVFDVADGVSITSAATNPSDNRQSPLPGDLRDGEWHYVVATYLPDFRLYTINGVVTQVPVDRGTASLYVDNQLVASTSGVTNSYVASNINDTALLLANNAGGAIDQFAVYNEALLPAPPLPSGGIWPQVSQKDVLGILKELGYPATEQTPNPGAIESAISGHWRSRNVNPNDALLGTFSSSFTPSSPGSLVGSWSQAAPLNPIAQPQATAPSAKAPSLQQDLVIAIAPSDWSKNNWFVGSSAQADPFNPANQELETITLVLTSTSDGTETTITRTLSPEQVLMGSNTIESLQASASISDFNYTLLSATPALNLVVSAKPNPNQGGDGGEIKATANYSAKVTLNFAGGTSVSNTNGSQTGLNLSLNSAGAGLIQSISSATTNANLSKQVKALATAEVIEAAPLQLKYIDSGVVLHSASSQAAVNSPAASSPAQTFGQSQAFGWFETSTANNYSSWLAIAQPTSANASSNPAGRVWIQYTGDFTSSNAATSTHTAVTDANKAPITWLNALANSNFSPENPNLPLINSATYKASYGGLLIQADPTAGWGQNFGQTMLVANIVGNNSNDLVISAPNANGGGKVIIIDGTWIASSLTNSSGSSILNLSNPENLGSYVTVLSPPKPSGESYENDDASQAAFGWALAVDESTSTLWIGAPNYSREVGPANESVPIGALYTYVYNSVEKSGLSSNYAVGMAGSTSTNDLSGPLTTYWGSQLGASLAFSTEAGLAVGAPGVQASMLYSGTEAAVQAAALNKVSSTAYGQGALIKIMLPTPLSPRSSGIDVSVSSSDGTSNVALVDVISNNTTNKKSALAQEESTYMQALKDLQTKPIVKANIINNPAIQTAAVGSVYLFNPGANLPTGTLTPASASKTFYGPNPWNTIGGSDFGASLSFADITNTNQQNILAVGAPQAGGSGAVYLVNTSQDFNIDANLGNKSLGQNQYLAYLTSALTLYGAEEFDAFGNGTLNLGDTNDDGYDDLLIQAFNAASGAGNGYVVFGGDNLIADLKHNTSLTGSLSKFNPAVGSVRAGNIGQLSFADGTSFTSPILTELGHGVSAATGQGSYGAGDVDSNGMADIPLGSGPNGSSYLTWGHPYLEAITNLQLDKLASNTGYLLDGLATTTQGSLRSIGDFNGDGYGDFISISPGSVVTNVRLELGGNTQDVLADYLYNFYSFTVANGTEVLPGGDINGDGMDDIALFFDRNLSSSADGNQGAGSTTGILYGRSSSDLPIGSGLGFLAPVDPTTSAPLEAMPGVNVAGGLTDSAPSVIAVGNTLYAAVKGVGSNSTSLWFSQSLDGGNSWDNWTNLSGSNQAFALKTGTSPSLAFSNNRLYLGFVNGSGTLSLSSWDPNSKNSLSWSTPSLLSSSAGSSAFSSSKGLQLVDRGDSLGVLWVNGGMVQAASSTSPDTTPTSPWEVINGRSSLATPALARIGGTTYMAVQGGSGDSAIYWTSSKNGGQSWDIWQALPATMTSEKPPSLAVFNGTLYLSYLGVGNNQINITSLTNANTWSNVYQIPLSPGSSTMQTAQYASLAGEMVNGKEQLAVYYVSGDVTSRILKTQSSTPAAAAGWSGVAEIKYNQPVQTASGPLTVGQFNGQTYLAYQGGIKDSPDSAIYIATSRSTDLNNGSVWAAQRLLDPGKRTGLGLASTATGLQLSYSAASQSGQLQLLNLTPQSGSLNLSQASDPALPLPAGLSANITLLNGVSNGISTQLFAGLNTSNAVETSLVYTSQVNSSWSTPLALQQLLNNEGVDIAADATPSFAWLGTTAVLAVKQGPDINVYAALGGGSSLQLTSSFKPPSGGPAIISDPVLTGTDTGLVLTYTNSDGSISLQRLNLLNANGTPVAGVQINDDGSINVSQTKVQWLSTTLDSSTTGISSSLASTPVNVNGALLLANVRNSASQNTQIWINSVPNLSDPASTTWLNTTVQLPDGKGGSILSQRTGFENSIGGLVAGPWQKVGTSDGAALSQAALTRDGNTVYMAVHGTDNYIWWNSSNDNGKTWNAWQKLPDSMGTYKAPSIAYFESRLYICYLGAGSNELNVTSTRAGSNDWIRQYRIPGQSAAAASMIVEGNNLAVYFIANDDSSRLLKSYSSIPSGDSRWTNTSVLYGGGASQSASQSASSNLALTRYNGQTYIAYQGGTYAKDQASPTIYLTTASDSVANAGGSKIWTLLNTPAGTNPVKQRGVGLTSSNQGLVLTYTDTNQPNQVAVQLSDSDVTRWLPRNDDQALSSSLGYTPLITADSQNPLLIAGMDSGTVIKAQLTDFNLHVLNSAETGSSLSAPGDINGDGFDDLAISANNVAYAPSGNFRGSDAQLTTGVRLVLGAATPTAISSVNNANASVQAVQIANLYRRPSYSTSVNSVTPVANLSGPAKLNLSGGQDGKLVQITSSAAEPGLLADFYNESGSGVVGSLLRSGVVLNTVNVQDETLQSLVNKSDNVYLFAEGFLTVPGSGSYNDFILSTTSDDGVRVKIDLAGTGTFSNVIDNWTIHGDTIDSSSSQSVTAGQRIPIQIEWFESGGGATLELYYQSNSQGISRTLVPSSNLSSAAPQLSFTGSTLSNTSLIASASNPSSLNKLFAGASSSTTSSSTWSAKRGSGSPSLHTLGGFGDLNADGYVDYLDEIPTTLYGPQDQIWSVWSIRAAGDANGNGVDDVLLSLAPQGPAYKQEMAGQPSALQSVLVDGSLFKVDKANNSFRLDQLRTPLNPYNRIQLYDVASTSSSAYLPSLQNWFEPILNFKPGSLTAASTDGFNAGSGASYTAPAVVISPATALNPAGEITMIYSGQSRSDSKSFSGSGLWMAYEQAGVGWTQTKLPVGDNAINLSPSAVYYQGKLTIAYTDIDSNLNIAWCEGNPQSSSATWTSYKLVDASSQWNPTLVVESGRLALYFPSNTGGTQEQVIRYFYNNDPFNSGATSNGNWGGKRNPTTPGYSGGSEILSADGNNPIVTSPIAATTFQGRTVLAFRSSGARGGLISKGSFEEKLENGYILLLTQVASAATDSDPTPSLSWVLTDTGQQNSNGVGLATDQALLYLTSTTYPAVNFSNPSPLIWSLTPKTGVPGEWTLGSQESVDGPGFAAYFYAGSQPLKELQPLPTVLTPFMFNGGLFSAWSGGNGDNIGNEFRVQLSTLNTTIGGPQQQSLAGYSLDGNIDINGDGFKDVLISDPTDPAQSVDNQYALFGGDYLNIASQVGTDGDDVLVGTPLADVIYTIQGADQVYSNGGADVIYTGAGDDQISINDNAFIRIDAGSGFDVLRLEGKANQSYDFRLNVAAPQYFAGTKLRDIELVSSQDYGANSIYLDAAGVNAINPDRILFLTPDSADSIILSPEFARNQALDTSYGGSLWHAYAAGPVVSSTSNPTLVYVLVPAGNDAASWLSEQVIVGGQGLKTLQSSIQITAANEPVAATGSTTEKSDPVLPTSSSVAGSSDFGEGLKLTAYRTNAGAAVANFCISRTDVSRSQIISYISSSRNSSADPGPHYSPVIGLVRLAVGEAKADITVPIDADAIAALRNGSVSLEVAELNDRGQKQFHLLLEVDHAFNGRPPTLSGLNVDFDPESRTASIGFRADINKAARAVGLARTLNLNVLSRQSANSSTADLKNRVQKLALSEGVLAKFDQDGSDNGQVELQFDVNASTGAILLQAAKRSLRPLLLNKLDDSRKSIKLGTELTTTSLDSVLLETPPNDVVLNKTAIDFTVEADADGKAKIFLDLTQVADDLEITESKVGEKTTRKSNHQLLYYGIDADGALSALTYNARRRAGARFYDIDGDSIADSVNLVFEDGGMGDTGPSGDGLIHDPSVGGVSYLTDVEWTAFDSRTLQASSRSNKDAPAALVVKVGLNSRSTSANQICYVVHDPSDSLSFDSIFADLDLLKARSQTLYTSLESTDVTLAPSTSLSREILLINGQLVRFFEVRDGTLNTLTSANDPRLRVLSTGGFSGDSRSVNAFSSSGVSLSLALVDGDQGLNALIGQEQGLAAVLDFTSFATDQKVEGSLSLAREAAFDAVTGFYRTLDIKGSVWLDPLDKSKGTIAPGQTGTTAADYGAAALRNMVDSLTGMRVDNRQTSSRLISLQESTYLAPIAQVNGHTFVSFDKGNTDGISHFVTLGTNTFGLEDLHGGGDKDYDDQIISLVFSKLVNPVV